MAAVVADGRPPDLKHRPPDVHILGPGWCCAFTMMPTGARSDPSVTLGPWARPAREVWDEIWEIIGPQIEQVMAGRGATWHENQLVPITRNGQARRRLLDLQLQPARRRVRCQRRRRRAGHLHETTRGRSSRNGGLAQLFEQRPSFMAMLEGPESIRFTLANAAYLRAYGKSGCPRKSYRRSPARCRCPGLSRSARHVFSTGKPSVRPEHEFAVKPVPGGPIDERFVDFIYQPITDDRGQRLRGLRRRIRRYRTQSEHEFALQ